MTVQGITQSTIRRHTSVHCRRRHVFVGARLIGTISRAAIELGVARRPAHPRSRNRPESRDLCVVYPCRHSSSVCFRYESAGRTGSGRRIWPGRVAKRPHPTSIPETSSQRPHVPARWHVLTRCFPTRVLDNFRGSQVNKKIYEPNTINCKIKS